MSCENISPKRFSFSSFFLWWDNGECSWTALKWTVAKCYENNFAKFFSSFSQPSRCQNNFFRNDLGRNFSLFLRSCNHQESGLHKLWFASFTRNTMPWFVCFFRQNLLPTKKQQIINYIVLSEWFEVGMAPGKEFKDIAGTNNSNSAKFSFSFLAPKPSLRQSNKTHSMKKEGIVNFKISLMAPFKIRIRLKHVEGWNRIEQ